MAAVKKPLFRGQDRRYLRKAIKVLQAIIRRDNVAITLTRASQALSTRQEITDYGQATPIVANAAQTLIAMMTAELALTTGSTTAAAVGTAEETIANFGF